MSSVLPIILFGASGLLVGGVLSLRRNGAGPVPIVIVGALAVLAAAGGVLWLLPGS
jgi:hypothetical protein